MDGGLLRGKSFSPLASKKNFLSFSFLSINISISINTTKMSYLNTTKMSYLNGKNVLFDILNTTKMSYLTFLL